MNDACNNYHYIYRRPSSKMYSTNSLTTCLNMTSENAFDI